MYVSLYICRCEDMRGCTVPMDVRNVERRAWRVPWMNEGELRRESTAHDLLCPEPNLMVVSILSPRDGADEGVNVYVRRSGNDWR